MEMEIDLSRSKWRFSTIATGHSADDTIKGIKVPPNNNGYILGYMIASDGGNNFILKWTHKGQTQEILVTLGGAKNAGGALGTGGTIIVVSDKIPLNADLPADDETEIYIRILHAAVANVRTQAGLLVCFKDTAGF